MSGFYDFHNTPDFKFLLGSFQENSWELRSIVLIALTRTSYCFVSHIYHPSLIHPSPSPLSPLQVTQLTQYLWNGLAQYQRLQQVRIPIGPPLSHLPWHLEIIGIGGKLSVLYHQSDPPPTGFIYNVGCPKMYFVVHFDSRILQGAA